VNILPLSSINDKNGRDHPFLLLSGIRNQETGIRSVSGGVAADQVSGIRRQESDQSAAALPPE
jgi:hypothetical protein